ncbi:MAG: peptidyl-prolyl cis-trans isomerase [Rhodospirillaceae bacterium]|nr:peptidyl-prolyl cis-trans isomerase [Rhodospirillaceae bacterium]
MLSSIRKQTRSWLMKALFGLLIAAFAVWGIGDVFRTNQAAAPIVRIGDDFIYSQADFDRELRLSLQRLSQVQGMQVSPALFAQFGGAQRLVDQAEDKGLLQVYGAKLGFDLPLQAVVQYIESDPDLANQAGRFDRARFEYVLRQSGQSEEQYVADIRAQMRASYILSALTGAMTAPQVLTDAVFHYSQEQRTAETVLVPTASITDVGIPDETALAAWHEAQSARYQAPELRSGTLVQMVPSDFIADVAVSEDEIQAEYQARLAEFSTPETRSVEQVVVQDPEIAAKIVAAARSGTAFAQAVRDATQGEPVSLGQVTKEQLPGDIADAVFALSEGSVSDPLSSPFGVHVVHVPTVTPATTRTLGEVEGELRNGLALGRAADAMESVRAQLEDELAAGVALTEAAQKLQLRTDTFAAIDASGQDRAGANLGLSPEAVALIFETAPGEPGYVSALSDGSYAVAQVDEIIPPALKPLAEVRDQAIADWTAAQQRDRAKQVAEEIAEKLKTGGAVKAEAEARGLVAKETKPFYRGEGDAENNVTPALAEALFKLKVGEISTGESESGAIVARLATIVSADPESQPDEVKRLSERVSQTLSGDLRQHFYDALKAELPVERDDTIWQRAIKSSEP